jgi:hypothetical protein
MQVNFISDVQILYFEITSNQTSQTGFFILQCVADFSLKYEE